MDETPLTGFNGVGDVRPDSILTVGSSEREARSLLEEVRERFRLPMTAFEIGPERGMPGGSA